jgi:hypothetical protein
MNRGVSPCGNRREPGGSTPGKIAEQEMKINQRGAAALQSPNPTSAVILSEAEGPAVQLASLRRLRENSRSPPQLCWKQI